MTNSKSARALDGDEVVAMRAVAGAGAAGRDGAGDVVAIDLAVGQCLAEFVRAAVGIRRGGAAGRAGGEAAIDAIAVAAIGDDENALLSVCGAGAGQYGGEYGGRDRWNAWNPQRGAEAPQNGVAMKMKNATGELRLR